MSRGSWLEGRAVAGCLRGGMAGGGEGRWMRGGACEGCTWRR